MKKRNLFAMLAMALLTACQPRDTFKLIGNIDGLEAGKTVALVSIDFKKGDEAPDTLCVAQSAEGKFELTGKMPQGPMMAYRVAFEGVQNQRYPILFLENKDITIAGRFDELRGLKVTGSSLNDEFEAMFGAYKAFEVEYEKASKEHSDMGMKTAMEKLKEMTIGVPTSNPNSLLSPFFILMTTGVQNERFIPVYENFSQEVKESYYGKILFERLPTNFVGTLFTDDVLNDRDGKPVTLKEALGKCTIIDFWASWCGPCRRSIPGLKNLYLKYHDQGLNIVSISVDREEAQWLKALDEEKMEWPNVRDRFDEQSVSKHYEVRFIPHFLLVGGDGKVLAVNVDEEEMERLIVEQLTQK